MTAGRFISFEGGEGVGKSTQGRMLADALRKRGIEVVMTREPGGTPGAEAIRSLLLTNEGDGWGARAEALLFAAARADHVEKLIRPAIARGAWVICDRFVDSSRAYQGGGSGLSDADVLALHAIGSEELLPDRTLLLSAEPEVSAKRLALRDGDIADRIGGRSAAYHASVAAAFHKFVANEPERFTIIAADGSPDDVHQRVLAAIKDIMPS